MSDDANERARALIARLDEVKARSGGALLWRRPDLQAAVEEAKQLCAKQLTWNDAKATLLDEMQLTRTLMVDAKTDAGRALASAEERLGLLAARETELAKLERELAADFSRLKTVEAREAHAAQRERELSARETALATMEKEMGALVHRAEEVQERIAVQTSDLLSRLSRHDEREAALESEERRLKLREENVEKWKLDLGQREQAYLLKQRELAELDRKKETLIEELGNLREKRHADLEAHEARLRSQDAELRARERELSEQARMLHDRSLRLAERKTRLDALETDIEARRADMQQVRETLAAREERVRELERDVEALEASRRELHASVARLGNAM